MFFNGLGQRAQELRQHPLRIPFESNAGGVEFVRKNRIALYRSFASHGVDLPTN
jgi:hypothetical protein